MINEKPYQFRQPLPEDRPLPLPPLLNLPPPLRSKSKRSLIKINKLLIRLIVTIVKVIAELSTWRRINFHIFTRPI